MALVTVPNAASIYTAAACVPNSKDRWVSVGLMPSVGASASAVFMVGSALASASPLLTIVCAAGQPYQSPIFNSPNENIMIASIAGGSAVVWLKAGS